MLLYFLIFLSQNLSNRPCNHRLCSAVTAAQLSNARVAVRAAKPATGSEEGPKNKYTTRICGCGRMPVDPSCCFRLSAVVSAVTFPLGLVNHDGHERAQQDSNHNETRELDTSMHSGGTVARRAASHLSTSDLTVIIFGSEARDQKAKLGPEFLSLLARGFSWAGSQGCCGCRCRLTASSHA